MLFRSLLLIASLGLAATAANAQSADFTALDIDVSGGLSLAEAQAIAPDLTADGFAQFDADGSGELSQEEFAALVTAMQSQ